MRLQITAHSRACNGSQSYITKSTWLHITACRRKLRQGCGAHRSANRGGTSERLQSEPGGLSQATGHAPAASGSGPRA
jgi:hypothetical protein